MIIIELVDSISMGWPGLSIAIYVIHYKSEISQSVYRFKSSNCHHNIIVTYIWNTTTLLVYIAAPSKMAAYIATEPDTVKTELFSLYHGL